MNIEYGNRRQIKLGNKPLTSNLFAIGYRPIGYFIG